jgi:dihydrofolate reductase
VVASTSVSLDGVMQAPGGPQEDSTGDFKLGGWLPKVGDDAVGKRVDKLFTPPFDLLLGRRTYDIFAAYWPYATGEWKALGERFDRAAKYVVTGGDQRLDWQNSHRLESIDAIADLKRGEGSDLIIQGSGTLYPQLLGAGLLDRLTLMTFPVILGSGKRCSATARRPARCAWSNTRSRRAATSSQPINRTGRLRPAALGRMSPAPPNSTAVRRSKRALGEHDVIDVNEPLRA